MNLSQIYNYINNLSKKRPVFHSEADFQLAFGNLLSKDFEVRLERPFLNIPFNHNSKILIPKMELDIFLPKEMIGIELKYKTIKGDFLNNDEHYNLKNHGAQNLGRFDFFEDLRRLTSLKKCGKIKSGFVVFLTNDHLYWKKITRKNFSIQFDMSERIIDSRTQLNWEGTPSVGSVTSKRMGNYIPILLENEISLKWREYSNVDNYKFNVLVGEV